MATVDAGALKQLLLCAPLDIQVCELQVKVGQMYASNAISQDIGQAAVLTSHHHATRHHTVSNILQDRHRRLFVTLVVHS